MQRRGHSLRHIYRLRLRSMSNRASGLKYRLLIAPGKTAIRAVQLRACFGVGIECSGAGEKDLETSDVPLPGVHASVADSPVVFLHDAIADPQAQSSALGRFGAEEGLKQLVGDCRMNALTRVDD